MTQPYAAPRTVPLPLEPPTPLVTMEIPRLPLPRASWLSPQTAPSVQPLLATSACHCNMGVGPKMTLPQLPGCCYYITPGNTLEPGNANTTVLDPDPTPSPSPAPTAATAPSHLQSRLTQPEGTTSLMNTQDPQRVNPSLHPATSFREQAPAALPAPAPAPLLFWSEAIPIFNQVIFWIEVKQ